MAFAGIIILLLTPVITTAQNVADTNKVNAISRVTVPGTHVTISLPDVFAYNPTESVYLYACAAASISVKELNGTSYSSLVKGMTKKNIESQGMSLVETSEVVTNGGQKGLIYITSLKVQSTESDKKVDYERIIFFTGNENNSLWITMNYPLITKSLLSGVLRKCLLTVENNN